MNYTTLYCLLQTTLSCFANKFGGTYLESIENVAARAVRRCILNAFYRILLDFPHNP